MRRRWNWNDILAFALVLLTFVSVIAVIPLVRDDPALKRARARQDCEILARAIRMLVGLDRTEISRHERGSESKTLLYSWDENTGEADSAGRWPRMSEKITPWLYYTGAPKIPSAGFQNVKGFLQGYEPVGLIEEERLMKAKRVDFDPWGRPYLINIGNMRERRIPDTDAAMITMVLSAGPNGIIETPDYRRSGGSERETAETREITQGDDIGSIVTMRRTS
jgi:hypothetical protein